MHPKLALFYNFINEKGRVQRDTYSQSNFSTPHSALACHDLGMVEGDNRGNIILSRVYKALFALTQNFPPLYELQMLSLCLP